MSGPTEVNGTVAKPPTKRSFFNKPSWSKPQPMSSPVDMFSRSHDTYTDIVAEEKRRRQEKLARKEQQRSIRPAADEVRESKRRRTSEESDDGDKASIEKGYEDLGTRAPKISDGERRSSEKNHPERPPKQEVKPSPDSLSERYEVVASSKDNKPKSAPLAVIDLENEETEDEELDGYVAVTNPNAHPPPMEDDVLASDEEFPELARKARERARLKSTEPPREPTTKPEPISTMDIKQPYIDRQPPLRSPTPPPDPIVKLFITSKIPNTKPLIVHRRLSQRLKDVKITWCQRQGFSEKEYDSIHLTWRGHKLFNVTTCKSLGIRVDEKENVFLKGEKDAFRADDDGVARIHMEAMTDEMILQAQSAREALQSSQDPAANASEEREPVAEQKPVEGIKIVLKSRGYEDFRLIVKASTPVSRIVGVFRQQREVPADKEVFLMFDGDRLDPESSVGDTDLSDLDTVEVHVK